MRRWSRAHSDTLCGKCGNQIAIGDPILVNTIPNVKREQRRGVCCAGDAPPELPAQVVPRQTTKKLKPLALEKLTAAIANKNPAQVREWLPYPADREPGAEG